MAVVEDSPLLHIINESYCSTLFNICHGTCMEIGVNIGNGLLFTYITALFMTEARLVQTAFEPGNKIDDLTFGVFALLILKLLHSRCYISLDYHIAY